MSRILSLSMRPRTLSGLFGQEEMVRSIRAMMAKRQPATWLLSGPSGCGKTTVSWIIAASFQCNHMKLWGDPCQECWNRSGFVEGAKKEFAIHTVNASDKSGIDDMRQMIELSRLRSLIGSKRVFILNEVQRLTSDSQNCALDAMEQPPPGTVWILCTTEPEQIKATVRRRCVTYELAPLGIDKREKFLTKYATAIQCTRALEPLFEQIHLAQIGSPALLLMALEKWSSGSTAEAAVIGVDSLGADSYRICNAVTRGDWAELRDALMKTAPEQARVVKASVAGWLRGCMAKGNGGDLDRASASLLELMSPSPIDDKNLMFWLWPVLHRITKRYSARG